MGTPIPYTPVPGHTAAAMATVPGQQQPGGTYGSGASRLPHAAPVVAGKIGAAHDGYQFKPAGTTAGQEQYQQQYQQQQQQQQQWGVSSYGTNYTGQRGEVRDQITHANSPMPLMLN